MVIAAPGGRDTIQDAAVVIGWLSHLRMYYGTEFHGYAAVEAATQATFYFATPHHAWERGTNENTNGLIRQYLPKRQSQARLTQAACDRIARALNQRPRKRLGYRTPEECYAR